MDVSSFGHHTGTSTTITIVTTNSNTFNSSCGFANTANNKCTSAVGLPPSIDLYSGVGSSPILAGALQQRQRSVVTSIPPPPVAPTNMDVIPYTTEELRTKIFEKYFKRNPTVSLSFRDEEWAVQKAFFDFVLHVPILIDGHQVPRNFWAKAFYETDVINSAKCLFEALFNKEEMSNCTLNGKNGTKELSAIKMLAILRASCWMKNKEQDPYNFNPDILAHNVHPTKDEQDKIEKKVFTERRSQANRKINKGNKRRLSPNHTNYHLSNCDSDSQHSEASNIDAHDNESLRSDGSVIDSNVYNSVDKVEVVDAFGPLEELYYQNPDDFLERLLPNRTEICIDGILIPKQIWERAFQDSQKDTVKAAWTLFQFLFSSDEIMTCTLNGKNGTTELCPVRKLAIIRAVQWMSKNSNDPSKSSYFDNDDDECNLFPSDEDKERIETKVFTEKRYQQSRQLNTKNSRSQN